MKPTLKGVAPAPSHPHVQLTMSLFQAREWWATTCGQEEEFAAGSLAVGELIVQQQGGDEGGGHRGDELICVGSLQGMLRIYNPSAGENVHALVVEENLGSPVLQMAIGYFVPAAPEMRALAVLHPRRLGVYVLHAKDSDAGNTSASTAAFFELVSATQA
jgi:Bardet-Biedl syndrome 9 protein